MPAQPSNQNRPELTLPELMMEDMEAQLDTRTLQEKITEAVGRFVVCKFVIGSGESLTVSGVLRRVGNSFFVLLDPCTNAETTCDLYSLKMITAYPEGVPEHKLYCNRRLYDIC